MTNQMGTHMDELIDAERKRSSERIIKLKRAAAAEQRRVDQKVIVLLRKQDADLYEQLMGEARDALADEKTKRSRRAKESGSLTPIDSAHHASRDEEHGGEVMGSW